VVFGFVLIPFAYFYYEEERCGNGDRPDTPDRWASIHFLQLWSRGSRKSTLVKSHRRLVGAAGHRDRLEKNFLKPCIRSIEKHPAKKDRGTAMVRFKFLTKKIRSMTDHPLFRKFHVHQRRNFRQKFQMYFLPAFSNMMHISARAQDGGRTKRPPVHGVSLVIFCF